MSNNVKEPIEMWLDAKIGLTNREYQLYSRGELEVQGLSKWAENNRIEKHLPIKTNSQEPQNSSNVGIALLGLGLIILVNVAQYVAPKIIRRWYSKRKIPDMVPNPVYVMRAEYYACMTNYLEKVQSGSLSLKDIKRFANYLDVLNEDSNLGNIVIKLSHDEIKTLFGIVYKFTKEICFRNNIALDQRYASIDCFAGTKNDDYLAATRELLKIQESIYA